jgi:RNA polymerase sigma-54 factor
MALESKLDLRLTQKLILTPQLQQAIKLLQMPQLELAQVLNQELTENPFLEEHVEEAEREEYREDDQGENTPQAASTDEPEAPFDIDKLRRSRYTPDNEKHERSNFTDPAPQAKVDNQRPG